MVVWKGMGETETAATPTRGAVVEGLLLALSHSKLRSLAQADALRDILNIDYLDMVAGGTLDLEVLWNLLAEHPEFDPAGAVAPMCVIKGWEQRLGMDVQLPAKLQDLAEKDIALKSTECPVPKSEVMRTLRTAADRARRESMIREALDDPTAGVSRSMPMARAGSWRHHRAVGVAAGIVCACALAFLAMSTLKECGGKDWDGFDATEYSGDIPVSGAQELGKQVSFDLADPAWLERPAEARREQMETALRALEVRGTKALVLRDSKGRVRATAQWFDRHSRIKVQLK